MRLLRALLPTKGETTLLLVLTSLLLLTGCHNIPVVSNDIAGECDHPPKPDKPYTDKNVSLFIVDQAKAIDVCRALLGNEPRGKNTPRFTVGQAR